MSLLKKIRRYSVFYILSSLCFVLPLQAKVFSKDLLQEMAVTYVAEQIDTSSDAKTHLSTLPLDSRIPDRICNTPLDLMSASEPHTIAKLLFKQNVMMDKLGPNIFM